MKKRVIIDILFVIYILILFRITVLRSGIGANELFSGKINFIPFADLIDTFKKSSASFIYLFLGNILWFVPFGFYLRKIKKCKILTVITLGFCLSLSIEIMQYIFGTGVNEIDDLMLNTVGALVGAGIAHLIDKNKHTKIKTNKKEHTWNKTSENIILTIANSFALIPIWFVIGIISLMICAECPFWGLSLGGYDSNPTVGGYLIILFLLLNIIAVIIFRRKLNVIWKYPLFMMASSAVIFLCGIGVISCGYAYYGHFTPQKWQNNPECRYLMVDNLEKKYKITGLSKQEITDLLGNPASSHKREQYEYYEYYVGWGDMDIDPTIYTIYFENDIVVNTNAAEG